MNQKGVSHIGKNMFLNLLRKIINLLLTMSIKLFMVFSSVSLVLFIYFIKEQLFFIDFWGNKELISCLVYFIAMFLLSLIVLYIAKINPSSSIEKKIESIELANDSFLPSYMGYFFVGLSIPNEFTLIFILITLLFFLLLSNIHYFNPCFLLVGYNFYHITTNKNTKIFLITKKKLRTTENVKFDQLKRINDFTFIDIGK